MSYWLLKSEPSVYSWSDFLRDKQTIWDGVRNYAARIYLREMQPGDQFFFYHSNDGKEIVGIGEIASLAMQDPSSTDDRWVAVKVKPVKDLKNPVTLDTIKKIPELSTMELVVNTRLSVQKVDARAWKKILQLSEKK